MEEVAPEVKGRKAETRDRQSQDVGCQEILERLRASTAATFGEERLAQASVREALETTARAVWLVGSEPLDPLGMEPHRHD